MDLSSMTAIKTALLAKISDFATNGGEIILVVIGVGLGLALLGFGVRKLYGLMRG